MQWKKVRTRREILEWFYEVDQWFKELREHPERVPDLRKPHSAHDGKELVAHARWLMNHIRNDLTNGVRVGEVREALGVLRALLSICARIPSGDLIPYVKE